MTEENNIPDEVERLPDTELGWREEEAAPKKKSGCLLPTWLWACGGGCLLMMILLGAGLFWGVGQVKNLIDPEVQWPRMQKVLPFDERPEHVQMLAGMQMFGMENYTLMDFERGLQISVYYFDDNESSDADDSRWTFFDPEKETTSSSMINRDNERVGVIRLGSRDRKVMRFTQETLSFGSEEMKEQASGPCLAVDVTPEDSPGFLFVMFFEAGGEFEIPDEHVLSFFESFYLD
ncbi:MAG: hypothetical protein MK291_01815 [Planctomycetes bacterium]|nr:hypothetical protein [Planctomycetota bacterium]